MPANPGRTKAVKLLKKRLKAVLDRWTGIGTRERRSVLQRSHQVMRYFCPANEATAWLLLALAYPAPPRMPGISAGLCYLIVWAYELGSPVALTVCFFGFGAHR
jgi:hypothetical protein